MELPFTREAFMQVFADYNHVVWPLQLYLLMMAGVLIFLVYLGIEGSGKFILSVLGILWLWMGLVYHILFFSTINKAAYVFGVAFILQAFLFFYFAINRSPRFKFRFNIRSFTAMILIAYALLVYPLIGDTLGHHYPYNPTFGLPCPTTIFTLGILLLSVERFPIWLSMIPLAWSLIGTSAAFNLGMKEDYGLLLSALLCVMLSVYQYRKEYWNKVVFTGKEVHDKKNEKAEPSHS